MRARARSRSRPIAIRRSRSSRRSSASWSRRAPCCRSRCATSVPTRRCAGRASPAASPRVPASSRRTSRAAILAWLNALVMAQNDASIFAMKGLAASPQPLALPPTQDGDDAEVVGIPLAGPGLHIVEIESKLLGAALLDPPGPMYVAAGAFVTNLAVHFKWGSESSLVWVTTLDAARPVAGAAVSVANCDGTILASATTDANGVARVEGLPNPVPGPRCGDGWTDYSGGLLVLAKAERPIRHRAHELAGGHRVVALRLRDRVARKPDRRAHDLRPHAAARGRHRAHEARAATPGARGLRAGAAGRAPREVGDRARRQRRQVRSRRRVGRERQRGQRMDDPEAGEARQLQRPVGAAQSVGVQPGLGHLPRRGVPRAADARRALATARRRGRGERVPARSRGATSLGRRRFVAAGDAAHADPPAQRAELRRFRGFRIRPGRRHRRHAPPQLR